MSAEEEVGEGSSSRALNSNLRGEKQSMDLIIKANGQLGSVWRTKLRMR